MDTIGIYEYNSKDLIGHGAFAVVYKGRVKMVSCFCLYELVEICRKLLRILVVRIDICLLVNSKTVLNLMQIAASSLVSFNQYVGRNFIINHMTLQ